MGHSAHTENRVFKNPILERLTHTHIAWPLSIFYGLAAILLGYTIYYGIVGPKGLPKDIVDKLNAAVRKSLEDPAVKKRIEDTGSLVIGNTPEQFAEQIKAEFAVYKDVVAKQKLTLE